MKITIEMLKARIQLLEFAGDDGIISDWVDLNEEELREEYHWVANLDPNTIKFLADSVRQWAGGVS